MNEGGGPAFWTVALALCIGQALFPSDVQWVNDEPQLVYRALQANKEGIRAPVGLMGTKGLAYGPVPTWIYQAYLSQSHDLVTLVALRAFYCALITALALYWIARTLKWWPWFALVPLCSPYLYWDDRVLWDNSFLIPLSALLVATYVSLLAAPRTWKVGLLVAGSIAAVLTHLMALMLVPALALHCLLFRPKALFRAWWLVLIVLGAFTWAGWPYWKYLVQGRPASMPGAAAKAGLWAPLDGARILTGDKLEAVYGSTWSLVGSEQWHRLLLAFAQASKLLVYLSWVGAALSLGVVVVAIIRRRFGPQEKLLILLWMVMGGHSAMAWGSGKYDQPHYSHAVWVVYLLLGWLVVDLAMSLRVQKWVDRGVHALAAILVGVVCGVLLLITGSMAYGIHEHGGNREDYGPTLGNQLELVHAMNEYAPNSPVTTNVLNIARFPIALMTLQGLEGARDPQKPQAQLHLIYTTENPLDAHVYVMTH